MIFVVVFSVLVILISAYLILIMPRLRKPSFDELDKYDYAHRGLHKENIPENSLSAFKNAVEHGYGMELDVRLSKDDEIMVMHDDNVKRMCGVDKKISEMTFDEIRELNLGNTNEKVPLFSEVLALVDGKTPLIVEVKETNKRDLLCKKVAEMLDGYKGVFCVESFDPKVNEYFKKNRPNYVRGQLMCNIIKSKKPFIKRYLATFLMFNYLSRPDFIAFKDSSEKNLSVLLCKKIFRAKGVVWTVRNSDEAKRFKNKGNLVIFENVEL